MAADNSSVAILMAVYEPRLDWLREQLESLNRQTCPNLRLYIRDDCSPTVPFGEIAALAEECITAFPFTLSRNEANLGSNRTFELLTEEAQGDLFAYCDQDDVWFPEKLAVLKKALTDSGALLACSDMYIIDGAGRRTAQSITQVRRHHVFHSGEDLAGGLLVHNFVTGCTMLVNAEQAKAAVPFCPYMVHDHYIALWCAAHGSILSVDRPLISYRIHDSNQTGLLSGVTDKASYGRVRIDEMLRRMEWLKEYFPCGKTLSVTVEDALTWAKARRDNWSQGKGKGTVWKYRSFSRLPSVFELFAEKLPEGVFQWFLKLGKENRV